MSFCCFFMHAYALISRFLLQPPFLWLNGQLSECVHNIPGSFNKHTSNPRRVLSIVESSICFITLFIIHSKDNDFCTDHLVNIQHTRIVVFFNRQFFAIFFSVILKTDSVTIFTMFCLIMFAIFTIHRISFRLTI